MKLYRVKNKLYSRIGHPEKTIILVCIQTLNEDKLIATIEHKKNIGAVEWCVRRFLWCIINFWSIPIRHRKRWKVVSIIYCLHWLNCSHAGIWLKQWIYLISQSRNFENIIDFEITFWSIEHNLNNIFDLYDRPWADFPFSACYKLIQS